MSGETGSAKSIEGKSRKLACVQTVEKLSDGETLLPCHSERSEESRSENSALRDSSSPAALRMTLSRRFSACWLKL